MNIIGKTVSSPGPIGASAGPSLTRPSDGARSESMQERAAGCNTPINV